MAPGNDGGEVKKVKRLKYRPVLQTQFATLVVNPKPRIGDDGYAWEYPTVQRAIRALPKRHGGVIVVRGKHRVDRTIKLPKDRPVTILGGEYMMARRATAFITIPKGSKKSHCIHDCKVEMVPKSKTAALMFLGRPKVK